MEKRKKYNGGERSYGKGHYTTIHKLVEERFFFKVQDYILQMVKDTKFMKVVLVKVIGYTVMSRVFVLFYTC